MAKYANVNTWSNNAKYGFGLIVVNGGDMVVNDPFEEEVDPEAPAKAYSAVYYDEDGVTEIGKWSADTKAELLNYDKKIPEKASQGTSDYTFES